MQTTTKRRLIFFRAALSVCLALLINASSAVAATITVNSTGDPAGFNEGITIPQLGSTITLRDAFNAARNTGGTHTITFAPSLAGQTIHLLHVGRAGVSNTAFDAVDSAGPNVNITIQGLTGNSGVTIARDGNAAALRLFTVAYPNVTLTLNDLMVSGFGNDFINGGAYEVLAGASVNMNRCTLTANRAFYGGAIYTENSTVSLTNCTLAGNYARSSGAGIYKESGGPLMLTNTTITNNTGGNGAGGMRSSGDVLVNTIVAGNTGNTYPDLQGPADASSHHNLIGTALGSGLVNGVNGNLVGVANPNLGTLASNGGPTQTVALLGAPAINAGATVADVTTDQRGVARPQFNVPDIGAYEYDVATPSLVVTTTVDELDVSGDPGFGTGTSLREALAYAQALGGARTITFAPALAGQTITLSNGWNGANDDTALRVSTDVTVEGGSGITINLAAPVPRRIFLNESTLTLRNLILSGGDIRNSNDGGALWNSGTVNLTNVRFTNNRANHGGAIYNLGTATINGSTFDSNSTAANGNGGAIWSNNTLSIGGSTFSQNNASVLGGAIISFNGLTVSNSIFSTNHSDFNGGALRLEGTAVISGCTMSDNTASNGGGALISHGNTTLTNVTIANNTAQEGGGAMFFEGTALLRHVTVARNTATSTGGGTSVPSANVTVTNTIVSGNSAPTNANLSGAAFNAASSNNLLNLSVAAAFLGSLGDNGGPTQTIPVLLGSPAIDAGVAIAGLTTDQRGLPRVINGTADIGAYEVQALPNLATPAVSDITSSSATVSGSVSNDGFTTISRRGVVYAPTAQNSNPTIGGSGVTEVNATGTTGPFSVSLAGLTQLTNYSFTSFVVTTSGTIYAPVQTFQTPENPSLTVTIASDITNSFDGQTSLREAVVYANSLGGGQRNISIPASLGGQTINLSAAAGSSDGWDATSALSITGNIHISGPAGTIQPGVTLGIDAAAALRHFVVRSGGRLSLMWLTVAGGKPQLASFNRGGAISAFGDLIARFCTFTENSSPEEGGAIQNWPGAGSLELVNCTFSGNSATNQGAAISLNGTQATLTHLTITNNTAPNSALVLWATQATMVNTILAGNSNDTVSTGNGGAFTAQSLNNLLGASSATGLTSGSNGNQLGVSVPALFLGPLADNDVFSFGYSPGPTKTIAISPASLAFNAGVPGYQQSDQRGFSRPWLGAADIGALEVQEVNARIPTISPSGGIYENSVQVTINNPNAGASMRYTLDGSTPSATDGILYTGPFNLTQTATVRAIAYDAGWTPSPVASAGFTIRTPLQQWRILQGLAADGSQDLANPSGDGIANLLKYAFNMAPNAGDLAVPNITVLPENGTAGLPFITRDAQGRLFIEFVRRKAATSPDIVYIVETGDDLTNLQPLDLSGASVVSIDAVWERVSVIDPVITPKRFGRVRVGGPYLNNFDTGLGAATLRGSAVWSSQAVMLTDAINSQSGAVVFDGLTSTGLSGFTARFNLALGPTTTGVPADGASFAVGDLGTGTWGEAGPGTAQSLAVGFDTYENGGTGSIGIHVWSNGAHVAYNATNPYTNGVSVPVEVSYDTATGLTVRFNNAPIFTNLAVPGFSLPANGRFGLGARTGGANERAVVDNVEIAPR